MSSTPLDLPVLISQLPHAAKIANIEHAKHDVKQSLFAPLIREHVLREQNKVREVQKKESVEETRRDAHHQNHQQAAGERKKQDSEEQETKSSNPSPWAGNIVDIKV